MYIVNHNYEYNQIYIYLTPAFISDILSNRVCYDIEQEHTARFFP